MQREFSLSFLRLAPAVSVVMLISDSVESPEQPSPSRSCPAPNSGSKFLIECTISGAHNDDGYVGFKLYKGSSEVTGATHTAGSPGTGVMFGFTVDRASGGNVGHHLQTISSRFLYTHGGDTSTAQEYRIYVSPMRTATRYFYYNRVGIYNDANQLSGTSSMTIWEIA